MSARMSEHTAPAEPTTCSATYQELSCRLTSGHRGEHAFVDPVRVAAAMGKPAPAERGDVGPTTARDPWHGCFTGDCPHSTQAECDAAIRAYVVELEDQTQSSAPEGRFPLLVAGNGFPRRNRVDLWWPAERAIQQAVDAVEVTGADGALTDAVVLLGKAKDRVSDYVDAQLRAGAAAPDAGSAGGEERRLREIEARLNAATPGPWMPGGVFFGPGEAKQNVWGPRRSPQDSSGPIVANHLAMKDAAFVAAAPEDVAWLIAQLRSARADSGKWRADAEYAAGECLVPIPEPGSDMARVCLANSELRRQRDAARAALASPAPEAPSDWDATDEASEHLQTLLSCLRRAEARFTDLVVRDADEAALSESLSIVHRVQARIIALFGGSPVPEQTAETPTLEHRCGVRGFNPELGDTCKACDARAADRVAEGER